jgi:hypothetical protein
MGKASFLRMGRTVGAGLLVTHSSLESLLSESDESLQEDPLLLEDPHELLEMMLLLGLFAVLADFSIAIGPASLHISI